QRTLVHGREPAVGVRALEDQGAEALFDKPGSFVRVSDGAPKRQGGGDTHANGSVFRQRDGSQPAIVPIDVQQSTGVPYAGAADRQILPEDKHGLWIVVRQLQRATL